MTVENDPCNKVKHEKAENSVLRWTRSTRLWRQRWPSGKMAERGGPFSREAHGWRVPGCFVSTIPGSLGLGVWIPGVWISAELPATAQTSRWEESPLSHIQSGKYYVDINGQKSTVVIMHSHLSEFWVRVVYWYCSCMKEGLMTLWLS